MDSVECYFQVALSHLQRQDQMNRDLESKAARSITGATALMGLATAIPRILPRSEGASTVDVSLALTVILVVSFIVTLICSLWTLWPLKWRNDPNLMEFKKHVPGQDEVILKWAGNQLSNAVTYNDGILRTKGRLIRVAMSLLGFMLITLALLAGLNA